MCGTGVESSRVKSGGGSCSVNALFFVGSCFKICCIVLDSVVLCVVVVVVRDVFQNVDTFF